MRYRNNRSVHEYWVNLEINVRNQIKHAKRGSIKKTASGKKRRHSKVRSSKLNNTLKGKE